MAKTIKRFSGWVGALLIIGALAFGASTAFASMPVCGDDWWEVGECPPFTEFTCPDECWEQFETSGECAYGCCVCLI